MSDEVLTQAEIDALLNGVDDGDVVTEVEEEEDSSDYVLYDLASQDRIVRKRLPTLELINERFARSFRISLFNFLSRSADVSIGGIHIMRYEDFIQSMYMPTSMHIVKVNPLKGLGLFSMEAKLVFKLVDNFFGGEGHNPKVDGRDFTPTELRVTELLMQQVFRDFEEAWQPIYEVGFEVTGTEVNPAMTSIVGPSDAVIVSKFHLEIDNNEGDLSVALPYAMIDPIKDLLDSAISADNDEADVRWQQTLRKDVMKAKVDLECSVVEKMMNLRNILDINEGDVIPVDIPASLVLKANGVPIFDARLGTSRGNLALEMLNRTNIDLIDT